MNNNSILVLIYASIPRSALVCSACPSSVALPAVQSRSCWLQTNNVKLYHVNNKQCIVTLLFNVLNFSTVFVPFSYTNHRRSLSTFFTQLLHFESSPSSAQCGQLPNTGKIGLVPMYFNGAGARKLLLLDSVFVGGFGFLNACLEHLMSPSCVSVRPSVTSTQLPCCLTTVRSYWYFVTIGDRQAHRVTGRIPPLCRPFLKIIYIPLWCSPLKTYKYTQALTNL